jgi:vacuolar iron transporter family protein
MNDHFQGKTALRHLAEVRSQGVESSIEVHGAETPGPLFALLDAARQTSVALLLLFVIIEFYEIPISKIYPGLFAFITGCIFWAGARSTLLSWCRLNRLHTIALEEKEEIDRNRPQEREELIALYGLKGFSGPLLDKVVDVLMADKDRLLKVMLQEEMGFKLEEHPHPLVQGSFASIGSSLSLLYILLFYLGFSVHFTIITSVCFISIVGALLAKFERNSMIPAMIWNASVTVVCVVVTRMCMNLFSF